MKLFENSFVAARRSATLQALADFIDEQSAFLVQKGIYEYSRARAGHYAKVMFAEQGFADAVERSRWRAFPLGLAMVGEMVEGVLASQAGDAAPRTARPADRARRCRSSTAIPFRRRSARKPGSEARRELARRLDWSACTRPSGSSTFREPLAEAYFEMMPIHEKLRGRDFPTTRNYLRVCAVQHP